MFGYKSKAKRDCKLESEFDSLPRKKSGAKAHSWLASQSLKSLVYISCPLQLKAKSLNQISFHFLRIIRVRKSCCEDQQYVSYKSCLIVNSVRNLRADILKPATHPIKEGGSIALIEFHSSCQSYHHPICWKKAKNSTLDGEIKILKRANCVGNRSFHWKTSDPNLFWVEKISVHVHSNSSSIETMLRQSSVFFCRFFSSNCVANVIFGANVGQAAGELGLKHSIKTHMSWWSI